MSLLQGWGIIGRGNGERFIKIDEVGDVYEAVRFAWRVDVNRVRKYGLVLPHDRDTVLGAFRPRKWLPACSTAFVGCKNFWV